MKDYEKKETTERMKEKELLHPLRYGTSNSFGMEEKEMSGKTYQHNPLRAFLEESNRIEGISLPVNDYQLSAAEGFLALPTVPISDLVLIVSVFQPDAILRDKEGLNVRVGNHFPISGGSDVTVLLIDLLTKIKEGNTTPYSAHQFYENLHPFTDCNGRSGRLLWLWQMGGIEKVPLGFLHTWYYQSLSEGRKG